MARISVVLVTFNRGHLLPGCLAAIQAQTEQDFELLICDDASEDETRQICEKAARADSRIQYLRASENLGMPANLNRGLAKAQSELVANLHDGDVYSPNLLERWAEALHKCERAAFVFNSYVSLDRWGLRDVIWQEPLGQCVPGSELLKLFFKRWRFDSPVWGTVMARLRFYQEMGYFDARFGFVSDVDMWLRLAHRYHVAYVDEPLIRLPRTDILPREAPVDQRDEQRKVVRMFWEARMRYRREHPYRGAMEVAKHVGFVAGATALEQMLACRRRVRAIG